MRLPRDLSGRDLAKALRHLGYEVTRQKGSHMRLTAAPAAGKHHITIPNHDPIKVGTLNSILTDVAQHLGMSRDDLLARLFS
jgi:predicted RNA binding protein YcfA (HicA-like mRNA interferase family)